MKIREIAWEEAFNQAGAFWIHDHNPRRPYARLSSGLISNGFFNGDRVVRKPGLMSRAVGKLMHAPELLEALSNAPDPEPTIEE